MRTAVSQGVLVTAWVNLRTANEGGPKTATPSKRSAGQRCSWVDVLYIEHSSADIHYRVLQLSVLLYITNAALSNGWASSSSSGRLPQGGKWVADVRVIFIVGDKPSAHLAWFLLVLLLRRRSKGDASQIAYEVKGPPRITNSRKQKLRLSSFILVRYKR